MKPEIAIIIPVFKHSALLPETISSALRQKVTHDYVIILVNDGCPFEETDIVCREYCAAYPNKIFYIHKPNGGLSSARNAGINFALEVFPTLDAIYLMDADNRIDPLLLQKSYDILFSSPENVGWAYPDIDKFGIEEFCDMSGDYNVFDHLLWNFCEAGSMVKRTLFSLGLRYDENMKLGYEDWEFWLQCIEAGFVGTHVPDSGFRYRQRGESMLKDSERHHEEIMSYIKKKHKNLFALDKFFTYENQYAQRFSFYLSDQRVFLYSSDVMSEGKTFSHAEFKEAFFDDLVKPSIGKCPPYIVITNSYTFKLLQSIGVLSGLLWKMQRCLDDANFVELDIESYPSNSLEISVEEREHSSSCPRMIICKSRLLQECVKDQNSDWFLSILTSQPYPKIHSIAVRLATNFSLPPAINAKELLVSLYHELHNEHSTIYSDFYEKTSVQHFRQHLGMPTTYFNKLYSLRHVMPILLPPHGLNIGIILPVAEFGGVEKVAFNYADVLMKQGHKLHLFVVGRKSAHIPQAFESVFSSITFFDDHALGHYGPSTSNHNYMGCPIPTWKDGGDVDSAVGMMAGMNILINFNATEFNSIMSSMRKLGIKTYSSQHLVDRSPFNQPIGTPHQFLAYEHAYDGVLVISHQLRAWFMANGVPGAKLIHIPNAASYPLEERKRQRILEERVKRKNEKMRVLYIGRFDRQKGLDRLATIIRQSETLKLNIEWRIVGKAILGGDDKEAMETLSPYLHPVAMTTEELNEHFAWADAMILVSRFEGVPLTILEAGRLGCAILTTNVGAIEESFIDGQTGYLFDSEQHEDMLVEKVLSRLQELASDRTRLRQLNKGAAEYYGNITWENSMHPFIQQISSMMVK
jgi:glycosyltransferase involved in cell wall biosynthesis